MLHHVKVTITAAGKQGQSVILDQLVSTQVPSL